MVQIGDKVKKRFSLTDHADGKSDDTSKLYFGKVIWIHPERRFYVAEFSTFRGEIFRSCFRENES